MYMNPSLVKAYIKYNYKGWIVAIALIILFYRNDSFLLYAILYAIFSMVFNIFRFKDRLERIEKLKAKGLTEEDIVNIEFAKKWGETRQKGVWNYCITDGGLIAGALLSIFVSIIYFVVSHKNIAQLLPDPGKMFGFIAYAYLTGATIGIISHRILWIINERRFLRLTDPLNTIFTNKKESFSDLI
jgi:hypothetical protein